MTIGDIAKAQRIPRRYLEGILNQLRKSGILEAQRGRIGGYKLARSARDVSVGEVVAAMDGPIRAVACVEDSKSDCPMQEDCVFLTTWKKVQDAIDKELDSASFAQLLEMESEAKRKGVSNYMI